MKIKLPYLVLMSCLMFAGQVWAQTPDFLKKRPKTTVAKTALHSSSSTGEPPLFPMRSGIIANDPAAKQAARPTRIYRKYPPVPSSTGFYNLKEKYECEYDNYGHITSLKIYEWNKSQEDYTFKVSVVSEYYQLPNGEFVKTKEEYEYYGRSSSYFEKQRYTSAYDDNGMQLWYQSETFNHTTSA
ncbi:MAG: hypothetical protein LBB73_07170 [Dysgonamonadaceae bacterium]|jgi:hypothetical protein|nr:hypothetical protein [Dysgonamonadaceae bacterium]